MPAEISKQAWCDLQVDHRALIENSTAADERQKEFQNTLTSTSMQLEKQMSGKVCCIIISRGWRNENEEQRTKFVKDILMGHLGIVGRDIKDINHRKPMSGQLSKTTHVLIRSSNARTSVLKSRHKYQHLLYYTDDEQKGEINIYGADSAFTTQRKKR